MKQPQTLDLAGIKLEFAATDPPSADFLARLRRFYAAQAPLSAPSAMWSYLRDTYQRDLHRALSSGDDATLAFELNTLYERQTLWGMEITRAHITPPGTTDYYASWTDALLRAAACLGVINCYNPESDERPRLSPAAIIRDIEAHLGIRLPCATAGAMFGLAVEGRIIPRKVLETICAVAPAVNNPPQSVLWEIGAGTGWIVRLMRTLFPACVCHTLDLPIASVCQACLLAAQFGEESIWLAGEPEKPGCAIAIHGEDRSWLENAELPACVFNQDSLPEMTRSQRDYFLDLIARRLPPTGTFFSINHETAMCDQESVHAAAKRHPTLRLVRRNPYWGRDGYLLEEYQTARPWTALK